MTYTAKKNIDILVPLLISCAVGFWYFRQYGVKKPLNLLAIIGLTFLAVWIATTRFTKSALEAAPHTQTLPADLDTKGCDSYDPTADVQAVYDDSKSFFFNSDTPYLRLIQLSDCQLVKAYNTWNSKFYQKAGNRTLPALVAGQSSFLDGSFSTAQSTLAQRFAKYNLS